MSDIDSISVRLNEEQLQSITKQLRFNSKADKRFDVNLLEGKLSESKWAKILETVEFKKDYKAHETGNIAVEYKYRGNPSGIATTKAKYVAYILVDKKQNDNVVFFMKTEILRMMCRAYLDKPEHNIMGGDNNESNLILLPVKELTNPRYLFA